MATPPTTYTFIPPPPLPEFYLNTNNAGSDSKSGTCLSSSASDDVSRTVVKRKTVVVVTKQKPERSAPRKTPPRQLPPVPEDATDNRMLRSESIFKVISSLPPPPPGYAGYDVPPLAVYHICRICIRPRSAHYHRDHPIPINGVPPPPGICRRCRVSKVDEEVTTVTKVVKEEQKEVEVVSKGESNEIKLGIACIVPEEDFVPVREMKERRGRALLESMEQRRMHAKRDSTVTGEERKITYRHVRVREGTVSPCLVRERDAIPLPPPKPKTSISSTSQDAIDAVNSQSKGAMMTTAAAAARSMQVHLSQKVDAAPTSNSPETTTKAAAELTSSVSRPERADSYIRKIAREEVERYRQAERKLEAHPGPYHHGRLRPVQRCIEQLPEEGEVLPWRTGTDRIEVRVERERVAEQPKARSVQSYPNQQTSVFGRGGAVADTDTEPPDRYTDSGWMSPSSKGLDNRDVTIERVVRDDQWQRGSEWGSRHKQQAQHRPVLPGSKRAGGRSNASEKTMWASKGSTQSVDSRSHPPVDFRQREVDGRTIWQKTYDVEEVWLPAPRKYSIFEVVEEVELYPEPEPAPILRDGEQFPHNRTDSRISERVLELQDESERKERTQMVSSQSKLANGSKMSTRTGDRGDDEIGSRMRGNPSSTREVDVRYHQEEPRKEGSRGPCSTSGRTIDSHRSGRHESSRVAGETGVELPEPKPRVRAFDRRWAAATEALRPLEEESSDRQHSVAGPGSTRPSASARSTRPAEQPEREYIHIERTVRPVGEPDSRRHLDSSPGLYYFESEELVRTGRHHETRPQAQQQARHRDGPRKQHKAGVSPSETSTRVRFANKVDFSPTPPGSDASSAQFRSIGASSGRKDRPKEEDRAESAEDLIAEYESRGRTRARDRAPRQEVREYYYERDVVRSETDQLHGGKRAEADDSVYRPRKSRPLAKALSESPSRERLSEAFAGEVDGHGPYHPEEPRPDSMDVKDGSACARASWADEYAFGRW